MAVRVLVWLEGPSSLLKADWLLSEYLRGRFPLLAPAFSFLFTITILINSERCLPSLLEEE